MSSLEDPSPFALGSLLFAILSQPLPPKGKPAKRR